MELSTLYPGTTGSYYILEEEESLSLIVCSLLESQAPVDSDLNGNV